MKFQDLNRVNTEREFQEFRMTSLNSLLLLTTLGSIGIVLLWHVFEHYSALSSGKTLIWLRLSFSVAFLLNYGISILRKSAAAIKQHLTICFYTGTLLCGFVVGLSGGSQSPYWFSLFFVLIAWFILVPFTYRELILHSLLFFCLFFVGVLSRTPFPLLDPVIYKMALLYAGILAMGSYSAYIRNNVEAKNYVNTKTLAQKNKELSKFRHVMEQAPGSVIIMDKEMNFEYINPMFTHLSGYSKEDLISRNIKETIYRGTTPESRVEVARILLSGEKWQGELLTYHKTGNSYWANTIASPYKDESGNIEGYIVIQQDSTERKKMEIALLESEELYRTLIEKSINGVALTRNRRFFLINEAFCKIVGYSKEELMQINPENLLFEEDKARILEIHDKRMTGEVDTLSYTARFVHKTGKILTIELNSTTVRVHGENASFVTLRDVTEQHALQEALKRSESRYKTLVENSQDGIFAIIGDKVHFVNNTLCKMLGYDAEELYNMPAIHMVIPEDREKGLEISQRRLKGDWSTVNGIFHFVAKDGTVRECDTYSSVLELNGQTVSYITVHDLTENRRMQEKLQQSEEKYRTVIENATDGIVITQNGYLKFLNSRMCEMLQYAEDELIDIPYLNLVEEQDHQLMTEFHNRRMAGEEFTSLYRSHLKRKDGSIITVELNARTSYYNGHPAAFIIIRDISDRVKIETELQMAKQNLEKLNHELEQRVIESSESLTEARTQLINLQKENLQSQFDVLKQQVNPHFLFNSLNVLTSLIKLEPDLAEKFTEHLSKVYRYVLENKDNELVKLSTELDFLDAYIFLLNIRFMGKLVVNIRIPEELRNCLVIPLAMQLLIENAIKHNAMSKKSPLVIDVFIDENHFLNILNNLQEREAHMASTGVGLKNIQNRYLLLNNTAPEFDKTQTHFIARIPLICDSNN